MHIFVTCYGFSIDRLLTIKEQSSDVMNKIDELKKVKDAPVVISDRSGLVVYANSRFLDIYQWTEELIGSSLNRIIPTAFHDSHNMGFSRFLVTGKSRIADHGVEAAVVMGDGRRRWSKHLIVVEKIGENYLIGAKLIPLDLAPMPAPLHESQLPALPVIDELRQTIDKMEVALGEIEDAIVWTDGTGDVILVYTDGVTEAVGENGGLYTVDRLRAVLEEEKSGTPPIMVAAVTDDVKRFQGKAQQADDITLICLQYNG
jgi:PAS domain-containing protein